MYFPKPVLPRGFSGWKLKNKRMFCRIYWNPMWKMYDFSNRWISRDGVRKIVEIVKFRWFCLSCDIREWRKEMKEILIYVGPDRRKMTIEEVRREVANAPFFTDKDGTQWCLPQDCQAMIYDLCDKIEYLNMNPCVRFARRAYEIARRVLFGI